MPSRTDIPRRRLAIAASTLACVAAVAGCGANAVSTSSGASGATPVAQTLQTKYESVVRGVSPSVVLIRTQNALGSGIVFDNRGDVVTNAHVIAGATKLTVTLSGGKSVPASVVGTDTANDIAMIRLTGATPAPAAFADSSKVQVGDIVLAIGNPLGLHSSVTEGIVSSANRSVSEGGGVTLTSAIQTSAQINPGNSGGALVNLDGQVVGIPTLAALDPEFGGAQAPGIGFAISSNRVTRVAHGLLTGK
ncbi:MAG: hypothetical protein QOH72_4736 [Solirubrobacteraceae bacterium]|jgi:S1-C subfamily serine protease|nr:hypothetical protein [Solirubrobacteraceae bacterium]